MVEDKKKKKELPKDFSFDTMRDDIDKLFTEREKREEKTEMKIPHFSDKIKDGLEIKNNLPDEGFLGVKFDEVNVTKKDKNGEEKTERKIRVTHEDTEGKEHVEYVRGIWKMDLRNDAYFWFVRTPEVIPQRIKQCIRAAIDRKKCYEFEKRKMEIPLLLLLILGIGAAIIIVAFMMMFLK